MELLPGRRQPGAGYEALHPELQGLNPEDYPDIHKMAILADVAPYSREYNTYRLKIAKEAKGNTELQIEYEKILDRVRRPRNNQVLPSCPTTRTSRVRGPRRPPDSGPRNPVGQGKPCSAGLLGSRSVGQSIRCSITLSLPGVRLFSCSWLRRYPGMDTCC